MLQFRDLVEVDRHLWVNLIVRSHVDCMRKYLILGVISFRWRRKVSWFWGKRGRPRLNLFYLLSQDKTHELSSFYYRYTYYALAALGRQDILWWKKYLTQMQMIQFILITLHALYFLSHPTCSWPKIFPVLEACHGILFFYLFYSFYRKNYNSDKTIDSCKNGILRNNNNDPSKVKAN